ncbi:ribosome maturation factor RimM [Phyllobacterium salinisoli]|uniref:Ribosome maturation factor RimM n=1 Tax=Phyllobacterium salinisoli TaxID=1899321 RepID=A0A368K151_9HYPH|nr:ribosome maturation factor RimM [Phyllobacterium salinisoli]RCS22395.1 ribosome maturation factor RimM [Phyllobacterium salinisoli]
MPQPENPVQLAVIGAPHGTRGEVRVKTFTGDPLALGEYGLLYDQTGRSYEIMEIREAKTVVVVRFKGVNDRNAAEKLNGTALFISREQLPEELDEDEFYHADLIGLEVTDLEGAVIGRVTGIYDFGGGDLVELSTPGRKPYLIPFTQSAVPDIDMKGGRLTVDPVAAGLVADDDTSDEPGSPGNPGRGKDGGQRDKGRDRREPK